MRRKFPIKLVGIALFFLLAFTLPLRGLKGHFSFSLAHLLESVRSSSQTKIKGLEDKIRQLELENGRLRNLPQALSYESKIGAADVIFRTSLTWQSFLWLNVGEKNAPFPLKNAPVLYGDTVVGVIEEVGLTESRVRLISDPHLNPSVRSQRNGRLLAKGELAGALKPSFGQTTRLLKGTGFNYDFPDEEGAAQDLHTPIILPGDLLVTTGFDGVFPKGLKVARVTKVFPLQEGDFYYDIEAESLAPSLNSLERLHLLPPIR